MSSWSLANATTLPQKDTAPTTVEKRSAISTSSAMLRIGREVAELRPRDHTGGASSHAVEERDHLGHCGHAHRARRRHPDHRPDHDAQGDDPEVRHALIEERGDDGHGRADGGQDVARARRGGVG
jgi:hypothetical protein